MAFQRDLERAQTTDCVSNVGTFEVSQNDLMLISGMELYSMSLLFMAGMNLAPQAKTNQ